MGLFILAAVSGTGKSTIARKLLSQASDLKVSVSHTTRSPRVGEVDGVDYHFVSRPVFEEMVEAGAFVEWAEYVGNLYGTAHSTIQTAEREGVRLLFDIEIQGARQLKAAYPEAQAIFLLPPSWRELGSRLRARGSNTEAEIRTRLNWGLRELKAAEEFDYLVVNDCVDAATVVVKSICDGRPEGWADQSLLQRLIQEAGED